MARKGKCGHDNPVLSRPGIVLRLENDLPDFHIDSSLRLERFCKGDDRVFTSKNAATGKFKLNDTVLALFLQEKNTITVGEDARCKRDGTCVPAL